MTHELVEVVHLSSLVSFGKNNVSILYVSWGLSIVNSDQKAVHRPGIYAGICIPGMGVLADFSAFHPRVKGHVSIVFHPRLGHRGCMQ